MIEIHKEPTLKFALIEVIGGGGQAQVYLAHEKQYNAHVAVKVADRSSFINEGLYFSELQKLYHTAHNHIAKIHYGAQDDTCIYLTMPLYRNGSIAGLIKRQFLTTSEIIRYGIHFVLGLNHIHSKGLIHFDIKPENILITDDDKAVVTDFGFAQHTGRWGLAELIGTTIPYAPPETFMFAEHNLLFDVYQAGLCLYRMCIGDDLFSYQLAQAEVGKFEDPNRNIATKITKGAFPDRNGYLPHINKSLRRVINKAMHHKTDLRYNSIFALYNALASIEEVSDWRYSTEGPNQYWSKQDHLVTCYTAGNIAKITAIKKGRRNLTYTRSVNLSQKDTLLYNCLNSSWT